MKILTTMVIAVVLLYMYLGDLGKVDDDYMTDKVHCEITVQEVLEGAIDELRVLIDNNNVTKNKYYAK